MQTSLTLDKKKKNFAMRRTLNILLKIINLLLFIMYNIVYTKKRDNEYVDLIYILNKDYFADKLNFFQECELCPLNPSRYVDLITKLKPSTIYVL